MYKDADYHISFCPAISKQLQPNSVNSIEKLFILSFAIIRAPAIQNWKVRLKKQFKVTSQTRFGLLWNLNSSRKLSTIPTFLIVFSMHQYLYLLASLNAEVIHKSSVRLNFTLCPWLHVCSDIRWNFRLLQSVFRHKGCNFRLLKSFCYCLSWACLLFSYIVTCMYVYNYTVFLMSLSSPLL